jgi:hypothetical protein
MLLKDHAGTLAVLVQPATGIEAAQSINRDTSPGTKRQLVEAAQQCGLAGARGSQQNGELTLPEVQRSRVQRRQAAWKSDMDIVHLDHRPSSHQKIGFDFIIKASQDS